jgi:myo-inositol-1-phosphate synthase
MKLEVWDSPNSAGIVIDAVRCAKLGLDHGLKGALIAPSSYFKKSPPVQIPDDRARELVEQFIRDPKAVERQLREKGAPVVKKDAAPLARKSARREAAPSHNGTNGANGKSAAAPRRAGAKKRRKAVAAR